MQNAERRANMTNACYFARQSQHLQLGFLIAVLYHRDGLRSVLVNIAKRFRIFLLIASHGLHAHINSTLILTAQESTHIHLVGQSSVSSPMFRQCCRVMSAPPLVASSPTNHIQTGSRSSHTKQSAGTPAYLSHLFLHYLLARTL